MFRLSLFVIASLCTLHNFGCCFQIQPRIVNGFPSERGQFPYYALLELTERFHPKEERICGGSLLNEHFVLTAAHCLDNVTKAIVHLGSLRRMEYEEDRHVFFARRKHFYVHPQWDEEITVNDIALIKLPRPAVYSDLIQPVSLPSVCELSAETELFAVGNGYNVTNGGDTAEILHYARLITIPFSECEDQFSLLDMSSVFCARGYKNSSICQGDSGGPLVDLNDHTIYGITSFTAEENGCDGSPQGFTSVIHYMPWISEITDIDIFVDCSSSELP